MALIGDAISHSILPGIVLFFVITGSWETGTMMLGAIMTGVLSVVLIEVIYKTSRIKADAAIGIVFTALFAIGVIMISTMTGDVHFDAECVLYGEIGYVALDLPVNWGGVDLLPATVMRMGIVTLLVVMLIGLFYKQLLVTSFDPGLAASLGIRPAFYHYGLTGLLAVLIVSAIEAVGVILVIAMIIFPGATGLLLSRRLKGVMVY
ncbi:MAG: ABC transporter, partial [Phototrophicales bacterium]